MRELLNDENIDYMERAREVAEKYVRPRAAELDRTGEYGWDILEALKDYEFDVKSSHEFRAPPHGTISLTAVCYERGGPETELSDRPAIRWVEGRPEQRR